MKEIGVGIIGTGFMCAVHAEALRRLGVTVRGVLGSTPEKSMKAAEALELPRGYGSLEEMLSDSKIKSIHVNTPNHLHQHFTTAAIRAGKHVMCEKPLARASQESRDMLDLAEANPQLVTAVNYNVRFYPLCVQSSEMIRKGEIGRIFHINGSVAQDWLLYDTDYNWRVLPEMGGPLRALSDIGSHWLDLMWFITRKEIDAVCVDFATFHPVRMRPKGELETFGANVTEPPETEPVNISTEDYGCVMLRFTDGSRGSLWVSQVSPGRKYALRFEIAGQERTLSWNSEACEKLWIGQRNGPNTLMMRDPTIMYAAARRVSDYPGGHDEGFGDSFKQCFRSFYQYIVAGDYKAPKTFATFRDGHRDMLLFDAFLESHRRGGWVRLSELAAPPPGI